MKLVTDFTIYANYSKEEVNEHITALIGEIRTFVTKFVNAGIFPGVRNGDDSNDRVAIVTGTFGDAAEEADALDATAAIGALRKILRWTADYIQDDPEDETDKVMGEDFSHTTLKVVVEDMAGMGGTKITMIHVGDDEEDDRVYRTIFILPILGKVWEGMKEVHS